ncbi:MAG: NAD-dependent epimerase/dehydratase family protein [Solirubrobacterales bacterium]
MASERVLVTGGAGFIGSNLVHRLLADGFGVRVLDNFATGRRENLEGVIGDVDLVEGDLQSYERVHNAVRGCEVVFHVGALPSVPRSVQDPLTSNATNVVGTLNVLLSARDLDVRRVVYSSSSSVYGSGTELPKHEGLPTRPIAPYAVSKLAGEGYCSSFTEVYGLDTVSLRYFNVFGPRQDPGSQYSAVIPKFIAAFQTGAEPIVHGDGEQTRDFTYIDNGVEANVRAALAGEAAAGKAFNIACGAALSLNEIVAELQAISGSSIEPRHVEPRVGDVRQSLADVSGARQALDYEPLVDAREGLRRAYEWYEQLAVA